MKKNIALGLLIMFAVPCLASVATVPTVELGMVKDTATNYYGTGTMDSIMAHVEYPTNKGGSVNFGYATGAYAGTTSTSMKLSYKFELSN